MKSIRSVAALALASTALLSGTTVFAQEVETQDEAKPAAQQPEAAEASGDQIVVVGSRIRRDTFNTQAPIQVVTREESTLAGFTNTTEALQGTGVTGGTAQINNAFGGFVTDGGPGANTLSLRGLGATRTLLLLNGRRLAPAGTRGSVGSADLNVLPTSIVERYEILKDGASSIYGSDAVAGVVNIVTRKDIDNFYLEGQYAAPTGGGGAGQRYSVVGGWVGDRLSVSGSIDIGKRSNLKLSDRDWTQCQTDYIRTAANRTPDSGSFIDPRTGKPKCYTITGTGSDGVTINTIATGFLFDPVLAPGFPDAPAGSIVACNRWRPNSAVTGGPLVGFECVGGLYFDPETGAQAGTSLSIRDTFEPRMLEESLISPGKFLQAYGQLSYDLQSLGNAELYAELLISHRKSSQKSYRQLSLDYAQRSPLLPDNLFNAPRVQAAPTNITNGRPLGIRAFVGVGLLDNKQSVHYYRAVTGLKGDFFIPNWKYDTYVSLSKSSGNYSFESFLTSRLAQSLNVVANGTGGFNCVDQSNGCVAAPTLTSAIIGGQLPENYLNFVVQNVTGKTKYNELLANFTVDGPLFKLGDGDVQAVLGFEYRHDKINDVPPFESRNADLFNLTSAGITKGSDTVWEVYGEVEFPLLKNRKLAEELTVTASARHTHYRSYGSDQTYKIGATYSPAEFLTFRATYGTSFRAPALFEQYLGGTTGFLSSQNDPCNGYVADGSQRAINCAKEGIAPGFVATTGVTVVSLGGASSGIFAETSDNFTTGVILQPKLPSSWGDLSLAVDYYNIEVNNGVSRAGATNILSRCYSDPEFRDGGGFCRLITRTPDGPRTLTVNNSYVNIATDKVRGLDYNIRYTVPAFGGTLRINGSLQHYLEQSSKLFPEDPLDDINGTVGAPKFAGELQTSFTYKKWTFRYGLEWIDSTDSYKYLDVDPTADPFYFETKDYFLHNASARYRTDRFEITAGVQNIANKKPPQISYGFYNRVGNAPLYSGYDYAGRTVFVTATTKF